MTPEERVKRLKDFDRWTVTSVEPRGVVAKRRPQWIVPAIAGVATAALTIGVVFGVVSLREYRALNPAVVPTETGTSVPEPTPVPSETPTSTPTSTPIDSSLTRPQPSIDLSCDDLVSPAELSAFMGVDVEAHDPLETYMRGGWGAANAATIAAGGLECEWSNGAIKNGNAGVEENYSGMQVSILPGGRALWEGDSLGYEWPGGVGCIGNEGTACDGSELVGTTMVEFHLAGMDRQGRTPDERLAGFTPILDALEAAVLAAGDAPELQVPVNLQWGGCDEFPSFDRLSDVTGTTVIAGNGESGGGWSVASLAAQQLTTSWCVTATSSIDYLFTMNETSDLGWVVAEYADVPTPQGLAVPLEIDGLTGDDFASSRCTTGENGSVFTAKNCIVDVVLGGNWIQVRLFDRDEVDFGRPVLDVLTDVAAEIVRERS